MKKLISLLATLTISASTVSTVISCRSEQKDGDINKEKIKDIKPFIDDIGRVLYLNKKYGYDMNWILGEKLIGKDARGEQFFKEKFNSVLLQKEAEITGVNLDQGKIPSTEAGQNNLLPFFDKLLNLDKSGDKKTQTTDLVETFLKIFGVDFSTSSTTVNPADQKAFEQISAGLNMNNYKDMNYNEAINKVILKLMSEMVKEMTGAEIPDGTSMAKAAEELTKAILAKKKANPDFGFQDLFQGEAMTPAVELVKLTLLCLGNFIKDGGLEKEDITTTDILSYRRKTVEGNLDLKTIVSELNKCLIGPNAKEIGPRALQNVIKLIISNSSKNFYSDKALVGADGGNALMKLGEINQSEDELSVGLFLGAVVNGLLTLDLGEFAEMITSISNLGNTLVNVVGMLGWNIQLADEKNWDGLIDAIKALDVIPNIDAVLPMLDPIKELLTSPEPLKLMWDRDYLGPLLSILGINVKLSIKGLLETSISSILGSESIMGIELSDNFYSISSILTYLDKQLATGANLDLSALSSGLQQLEKILKNVPKSEDALKEKITDDIINNFFALSKSLEGFKALINDLIDSSNKKNEEMIKNAITNFHDIKVVSTNSENEYTLKIEGYTIKITCPLVEKYYKISKISVI